MFIDVPAPDEMAQWDRAAGALGMPADVLMENAARAATAVLRRLAGPLAGRTVLLFGGGGSNGGDAFCMARHMLDEGASPVLVRTKPSDGYSGAAGRWLAVAERLGVPSFTADEWMAGKYGDAQRPGIVVDGLLGTGFHGELRERERGIVGRINGMRDAFIFSIDVPSGLDSGTGRPSPEAVRADATVTFQAPKPGLLLPSSRMFTGRLEVVPIGIPGPARAPASFRTITCPWQAGVDGSVAAVRCPAEMPPLQDMVPCAGEEDSGLRMPAHKGEAGRVLVVGGCGAYAGAPVLACRAAFRAGAGLVRLAAPRPAVECARNFEPAATVVPLSGTDGIAGDWDGADAGPVLEAALGSHAVVLGPGIGKSAGAAGMVSALVKLGGRPSLVIDADALGILAGHRELLPFLREDDVLTPHPGEAAALLGISVRDVQARRFGASKALAALAPSVWVLKGEGTLVSSAGKKTTISPWGVPQLAVAGSGDVLAGTVGALAASRSMPADECAAAGVWMHALAGCLLAGSHPFRGCSPADIADALPRAAALFRAGTAGTGRRPDGVRERRGWQA